MWSVQKFQRISKKDIICFSISTIFPSPLSIENNATAIIMVAGFNAAAVVVVADNGLAAWSCANLETPSAVLNNIKILQEQIAEVEKKAKEKRDNATALAEKLGALEVLLEAEAGEKGRLFGAVSAISGDNS